MEQIIKRLTLRPINLKQTVEKVMIQQIALKPTLPPIKPKIIQPTKTALRHPVLPTRQTRLIKM
jgi:hypothetical protein